jgi:general secretion pathway protein I
MSPRRPSGRRRGLSLMEVLVALAIFLLAFIVLGRLVIFGSDQALDAQHQGQAADLCQTKMAEVIAGALPLTSQSDVPFEEDPGWHWSLDCEKSNYPGLWTVTVRVSRQEPQRTRVLCKLTQMVLDPQMHGNILDTPPGMTCDSSSTGSSSSSSGRSSRSPGGGS